MGKPLLMALHYVEYSDIMNKMMVSTSLAVISSTLQVLQYLPANNS